MHDVMVTQSIHACRSLVSHFIDLYCPQLVELKSNVVETRFVVCLSCKDFLTVTCLFFVCGLGCITSENISFITTVLQKVSYGYDLSEHCV